MMRLLVILILTHSLAVAQVDNDLVRVTAPLATMQRGGEAVVRLVVDVVDGYHIQAHEVKDEFLIPTTLSLNTGGAFVAAAPVFPATHKFRLEGTDEYLDVFDGKFEIEVHLRASPATKDGLHRVEGELHYQACDSIRCLFPRTAKFVMAIQIN